jgi:hypothetical protein
MTINSNDKGILPINHEKAAAKEEEVRFYNILIPFSYLSN